MNSVIRFVIIANVAKEMAKQRGKRVWIGKLLSLWNKGKIDSIRVGLARQRGGF